MARGGIQVRPVITDKQRNGQLTMTRIKTGKEGHQGTLNYLVPDLIVPARGVNSARNENFENGMKIKRRFLLNCMHNLLPKKLHFQF